jgi:transposase
MDADPRDKRIHELEAEVSRLRAENQQLRNRLDELERAAARQAAPFRRREKAKKPPDQHKRPGRPPGHPPAFRPPPDHVDQTIEVPLDQCPQCGGVLTDVQSCVQYIEEIPPVRPHVTKLTTHVGMCPCCGEVRSTHPLQVSTACGAAGTHLGARSLAMAAWLNK